MNSLYIKGIFFYYYCQATAVNPIGHGNIFKKTFEGGYHHLWPRFSQEHLMILNSCSRRINSQSPAKSGDRRMESIENMCVQPTKKKERELFINIQSWDVELKNSVTHSWKTWSLWSNDGRLHFGHFFYFSIFELFLFLFHIAYIVLTIHETLSALLTLGR